MTEKNDLRVAVVGPGAGGILAGEMNRNFGFLVNDISRLISAEYNRMMKPLGLTRAQWRVIVHLHRKDGLTQVELARLLGTGKVAVGGLVNRLEKSGWVKRRIDPDDRRANCVFLTGKGHTIEGDMISTGRVLTTRILSALGTGDRKQLIELLMIVKQSLVEMEAATPEEVGG